MSRPPEMVSGFGQTSVLLHTFLARFFENEATAGQTDLRESFFWLSAALAAPGMFFAFYEQFHWTFVALGPDGGARLRAYVLVDKTLYLAFTSVAMGLVSAAVWNTLVVDRRDAIILTVLPVRRWAIVAGKLLSLGAYVGLLNLGMHAGSALLFGFFLNAPRGWAAVTRGVAAHLAAGSAAGVFVFLMVVALQSVCLTAVGPRRFGRVSAGLQMVFVAAIIVTLLVTPALCHDATSLGDGSSHASWLGSMPPLWFLGMYESLAGTASGVMRDLARTGTLALGSGVLAVAVFYPIACMRVLTHAAAAETSATRPWSRLLSSMAVDRLTSVSGTRAALQFLLATAGRVAHFRLVLSVAIGLGVTLLVPVALYWIGHGVPSRPYVSLLAAPMLVTIPLTVGWRVIVALPSEVTARWVFRSAPMERVAGRAAVRRLILASGVWVPVALFTPVWIAMWGFGRSWLLVVNALLAGGILVEALLWGFADMPCTHTMAMGDLNLHGRWPFYATGLLAYALGIPILEVLVAGRPTGWALTIGLLAAYGVVRRASNDAAHINVLTDDQRGLLLLDLAAVPPAPTGGARPTAHGRAEYNLGGLPRA